jgi:hypothetical protein
MNIYHLSQSRVSGYDTYSDCVVVSECEETARNILPSETASVRFDFGGDWCEPQFVEVEYIGIASDDLEEGTVICASFHAG